MKKLLVIILVICALAVAGCAGSNDNNSQNSVSGASAGQSDTSELSNDGSSPASQAQSAAESNESNTSTVDVISADTSSKDTTEGYGSNLARTVAKAENGFYMVFDVTSAGQTCTVRQAYDGNAVSTHISYSSDKADVYRLYSEGILKTIDKSAKTFSGELTTSNFILYGKDSANYSSPLVSELVNYKGKTCLREGYASTDGTEFYYFQNGLLAGAEFLTGEEVGETWTVTEISDSIPDDMMMKIPDDYTGSQLGGDIVISYDPSWGWFGENDE